MFLNFRIFVYFNKSSKDFKTMENDNYYCLYFVMASGSLPPQLSIFSLTAPLFALCYSKVYTFPTSES